MHMSPFKFKLLFYKLLKLTKEVKPSLKRKISLLFLLSTSLLVNRS